MREYLCYENRSTKRRRRRNVKSLSGRSQTLPERKTAPAPPWEICPAKSAPFKTIRRHALESGAVFEALRRSFSLSEELLSPRFLPFALGHDCGKLSPGFISKLPGDFARDTGIGKLPEYQRHEVISEAAFADFLKGRADHCETIVGWHHGRRDPSPRPEGAVDYGGEPWRIRRREFLEWVFSHGKLPQEPLTAENRMLTAGIVCLADWIASDERNFTEDLTDRPFEDLTRIAVDLLNRIGFRPPEFRPGLQFREIFDFSPNPGQQALAEQAVKPGIFLLENTMGSGKTEAALYAAYRLIVSGMNRGIFFALPTRLTSNRIHQRVNSFLERVSVSGRARLIHGTAWLEPAGGEELAPGASWFAPAKRALLEPFGVGTVDQALKGVLNVRHFFVRLAGLAGKVVIFDEVHAFDEYMHYLLVSLCRILVSLNCTVILLSATLPARRRADLLGLGKEADPGGYPSLTVHLSGGEAREFVLSPPWSRNVRITMVSPEKVVGKAVEAAARGCNVALIANTVGDAQEFFRRVRAESESGAFPLGLLHSRFPLWRRNEIEQKWLDALGKNAGKTRPRGSLLISTQIIEQSVDMDFDLMISETAPGELLFQRMGRLWRHRRDVRPNAEPEFCRIDWDLCSASSADEVLRRAGGSGKVYPPFLLLRAEKIWRKYESLDLPEDMRALMEENFRPPDSSERIECELYGRMMDEAEAEIRKARTASQLDLISSATAQTGDDEDAPTRLADCPQRTLLLLNSIALRGRECDLVLSDGSSLSFREEEAFSLDKMRKLAVNTAPVPKWWLNETEDCLPDVLERYWKYDKVVPVCIGAAGELCLPDGRRVPIRYDNDNGIEYERNEQRKEEDETVFADW